MSRRVTVLLAAAMACTRDPIVLGGDLPIDHLAALELDAAGAVLRATPLRAYPGERVELAGEKPARLAVAGYAGATLADAFAGIEPSAIARTPLAAAPGCTPKLPPPDLYLTAFDAETFSPAAPELAPPLGAAWLEDACPRLDAERIAVHARCQTAVCLRGAARTGACRIELDLSTCFREPLSVVEQPGGRLCVEPAEGWSCEPVATSPEAAASVRCTATLFEGESTECSIDLYSRPETPRIAVERRVTVVPGAAGRSERHVSAEDVLRGYLFDLAIAGDRVFVSAAESAVAPVSCMNGDTTPATKLHVYDAQSFEELAAVDAPPCSMLLHAAGPEELFGVHPDPARGAWIFDRFDRSGVVTSSTALPELVAPRDRLAALIPAAEGRALYLAAHRGDRTVLLVLDARTLALEHRFELEGRVRALAEVGPGALAAAADEIMPGRLYRIALDPERVETFSFAAGTLANGYFFFNDILYERSVDRTVFLAARDLETLFSWQGDEFSPIALYEARMQPARMIALGGGRVLLSGITPNDLGPSESLFGVLDVERQRLLPGLVSLGAEVGPAGRMRIDSRGRVWLMLGWSGELAVVRVAE